MTYIKHMIVILAVLGTIGCSGSSDNNDNNDPSDGSQPMADTQAPTTPAALSASAASARQINLSWSAATDNVGVTDYDIYRNGTLIANVTGTSYSDTGLLADTAYTYQIRARDAAGNTSALSVGTSITTPTGDPLLFFDDFEYTVGRSDPQADTLFQNNGWDGVKTQQSYGSGFGYLYTVDSIPGYSGSFPGLASHRALAIEARPATFGAQTDFYLQLGDGYSDLNFIPGDVWFQFWLYPQYYGDQLSQFRGLDKFLYPCGQGHGSCHTHKSLRFPTTIGSSTNTDLYDFWLYLDDFAMASSEGALPIYE